MGPNLYAGSAADYRRKADGFELLTVDGLTPATALPKAVTDLWKPANANRVGADITRWL
jgi:hypothetical protein